MTRAEMISAIQVLQQEVWGLKEQVARLRAPIVETGRPGFAKLVTPVSVQEFEQKPAQRRSKERA